ncbi:hypothetical protein [Terrabacter sp. NPDC000476]|uniref:hypothetical protein n=1 Tax=Terrabacter sp. NPDC000476 TaxID=3154258 RepID=UPI00331ADB54
MARTQELSARYRIEALSTLASLTVLDQAIARLSPTPGRPPALLLPGSWPDQLAWGIDSAVATVRMLLCGQFIGAAAIARNQLERWTANRAFLARVDKTAGESDADFIARVWSSPVDADAVKADPELHVAFFQDAAVSADELNDHAHVTLNDGREVCPAAMWSILSELVHGRGPVGAVHWEVTRCLDPDSVPTDVDVAAAAVIDATAMNMAHLRRILEAIHLGNGWTGSAKVLKSGLDSFSLAGSNRSVRLRDYDISEDSVTPGLWALAPLTPGEGLNSRAVRRLADESRVYARVWRGERPAGRLFKDDEMVTIAFAAHRYRSVLGAQAALRREKDHFGKDFDLQSLASRATIWTLVSEALGLLGEWLTGPAADAAVSSSAAIRSSGWLWLEDDDRSMAVQRTVLEQLARLRTWRRRPDKAARLDISAPSPSRWLEAAGWRRLGPLNVALGEFAHLTKRSDWGGARELLVKLQVDTDPDLALFTARGSALDLTQELAAREAVEGLRTFAPQTAECLVELLGRAGMRLGEVDPSLERHLNHVWEHNAQLARRGARSDVSPEATEPAETREVDELIEANGHVKASEPEELSGSSPADGLNTAD